MNKQSKDIDYGTVLCDMHDSINIDSEYGLSVVNVHRFPAVGAGEMIEKTVRIASGCRFHYVNKYLVITGELSSGNYLAMGSYDDQTLIVVELSNS